MIEIQRVAPDRWPDLERFFESRGTLRGCWCMIFRAALEGEVPRANGPERKRAMHGLVHAGMCVGLLGYSAGAPVAWCSLGPRGGFPGLAVVEEVSLIVAELEARVEQLLNRNRLERLAEVLLERETVYADEAAKLFDEGGGDDEPSGERVLERAPRKGACRSW